MKLTYKFNTACIVLGALCVISLITGCKKLVSIDQPLNTLTTADVFSTDAQANSAMAGIYSQLMTNSGGNMIFSNGATSIFAGLSADELVSYAGVGNADIYEFESNTLISTNNETDPYFWKPAYHIIYSANAVIEGAAASTSISLTDSTRTQITGESKFVRAFSYFYLTNLFGNVPLVLTTDFNQTVGLSAASQAAIYKQINQDLLDAQATLKTNYSISGGERIRANKWAATALLARAYLYEQDWKDAETQASAVIANSQYSLVSNLANVFNKNSTEAILQFQQNITASPYSGTYEARNFIPSIVISSQTPALQAQYLSTSIFPLYGTFLYPTYYLSPQLTAAFEANDQRKTLWTNYTPTPTYAPYTGVNILWPYKYTSNTSSTTVATTQYYMVLRLAEQYLIRAEARAQQGNTAGATADLNVIRSRAGLPATTASTQADLLTAIAHERQIELFSEWGHRFFDLKRTKQATAVLSAISSKQPWNDYQLLYPIPPNEVKADAFLLQNPGYF
jgi:hypothetical protein